VTTPLESTQPSLVDDLSRHCGELLKELRALPSERIFENVEVSWWESRGPNQAVKQQSEISRPIAHPAIDTRAESTFQERAAALHDAYREIRPDDRVGGTVAEPPSHTSAWRLLDAAVFHSLDRAGSNANLRTARRVAPSIVQHQLTGRAKREDWMPLQSPGWPHFLRLAADMSIRRIPTKARPSIPDALILRSSDPTFVTHALVLSGEVPGSLGGFDSIDVFQNATLALLLAGMYPQASPGFFPVYPQPSLYTIPPGATWWAGPMRMGFSQPVFDRRKARQARLLLATLRIEIPRRARLALDRLLMAEERNQPQDRLIDSWIGLEAVLLPGQTAELTYRARLRGAALAGGDTTQRRRVVDLLRASYEDRSRLVHGGVPKDGWEGRTEQVRGLLIRFLIDGLVAGEFPDEVMLDNLVVGLADAATPAGG